MGTALDRYRDIVYQGNPNQALLGMITDTSGRVLDVGCGDGANARALVQRGFSVWGLSASEREAVLAQPHCEAVYIADIERDLPEAVPGNFDGLVMSHVLEHLADPKSSLVRLAERLRPGGWLAAAVPNMAHWSLRRQYLRGDFRRTETGPMDHTHLQWWSMNTIASLFSGTPFEVMELACEAQLTADLEWRKRAPHIIMRLEEKLAVRFPNFWGFQILVFARKTRA